MASFTREWSCFEKRNSFFFSATIPEFPFFLELNLLSGYVELKTNFLQFLCHMTSYAKFPHILFFLLHLLVNHDAFQLTFVFRSSHQEVFLEKGFLKICSKFTGESPCRSVISIKLQSNFMEITLRHGCSHVNLLHIFSTPFLKNTSGRLLPCFLSSSRFCNFRILNWDSWFWKSLDIADRVSDFSFFRDIHRSMTTKFDPAFSCIRT